MHIFLLPPVHSAIQENKNEKGPPEGEPCPLFPDCKQAWRRNVHTKYRVFTNVWFEKMKSFCKKYASKANQPAFSSCVSPPVCCGGLETDQEWLPSVPSSISIPCSLHSLIHGQVKQEDLEAEPAGTQMSKGIYLIWGGHFFSIFCNYQLQLFSMLQLSLWAKNSGTKFYENKNTFQNETIHDTEF